MPNLSGWTGLLLVVIVIVLFAAPKLPQIAKSIAQSANVFKKEIKSGSNGSDDDTPPSSDETTPKN